MSITFGVEIEFEVPARLSAEAIAAAISTAGLQCAYTGYTHQQTSIWKVVTDGSLSPTHHFGAHELVSPVLTLERIDEIDRVCGVLAQLGGQVNKSCGLHVHVGARDMTLDQLKALALLYIEGEDVIDTLLPPSRRESNNNFCLSMKAQLRVVNEIRAAEDIESIARAIKPHDNIKECRYVKLNFVSMLRQKTVEFRHHSSTIDPVKIKNWAIFCIKMVEAAKRPPVATPTLAVSTPTHEYWTRGRRTRTIYALLTRPEGATGSEVQEALGVRSTPDIRWHLERAGADTHAARVERRNGQWVFKLPSSTPATVATAVAVSESIATLDALLDKLQMTPAERVYWVERAAMLSPTRE